MNLRVDLWAYGPRLGPFFILNIRIGFPSFGPLILAILVKGTLPYKLRVP